jgi:DNA-binding beta-propeller fold protein YncE
VLALLSSGCAAPDPIFPNVSPPIVWPAPPDRPRIRWIGELRGEADLHAPRSFLRALGDAVTGPPPPVRFGAPMAVDVDGMRVAIADPAAPGGAGVHLLDLDARTFATIRDTIDGPLQHPIDVAFDRDAILIADAARAAVFRAAGEGHPAGRFTSAELARPTAIARDPATGRWFVVDSGAHAVAAFDPSGRRTARFGGRGADPGLFNFPTGIACAAPNQESTLVVTDAMNFRVQRLTADGAPLSEFGRKGDGAGDFSLPRDVALDSQGHLYVLDNQFENVQVFNRDGQLLMAFGQEGDGPGQFNLPSGITIDARDRIWIADTRNRRIQVFQYLREDASP